jgi:branched-chain amino acid transport system ATP-binding protein
MSEPLLSVKGLSAGYGAAPVLFDIGFEVGHGEIVALVGSNGAGKTTLLRAISRLIDAQGAINFAGHDLMALAPEQVFALGLVQVPEGRQLFPRRSVEEKLLLGGSRRPQADLAGSFERVYQIFPILGERRKQWAGDLSGGEQQMCALARALMADPKLLVEQDVFAAFSVADRGYVLETGRIVHQGRVADLERDPALQKAYLGVA